MIKQIIENMWPNLYLDLWSRKYFRQNLKSQELVKNNMEFLNKHRGERCFILGNGPSLKLLDFSKLKNEITFTVNQLPRNEKFIELQTTYHFWADERFFELDENRPEDMELIEVMKRVNTGNNPVVFYPVSAKPTIERFELNKNLNIKYFIKERINREISLKETIDLCKPQPIFSTVIQNIICIAVYMGFSEIYLLGCDCTGFIGEAQKRIKSLGNLEYGYKVSANERKRMERISKETTIEDELMWYIDLLNTYKTLRYYCSRHGVALYNATDGGLLDCVERKCLKDIL